MNITPSMTIRQLRDAITASLAPLYDSGETAWMTRAILEFVSGKSRVDLILDADKEAGESRCRSAAAIVNRLLTGEPLQYILGHETFMGLEINVTPATLIPRPETVELVEILLRHEGDTTDLKVLDAGTGSGCIALALGRNLRFPQITATDISDKALEVARANAHKLKITNVTWVKADMLNMDGLPGAPFDIIISNPPYVLDSERMTMKPNVLDYEPANALFVPDDDPLRFYKALTSYAIGGGLKPNGRIYFEANPLCISALSDDMTSAGWEGVTVLPDSSRHRRFLTASLTQPW